MLSGVASCVARQLETTRDYRGLQLYRTSTLAVGITPAEAAQSLLHPNSIAVRATSCMRWCIASRRHPASLIQLNHSDCALICMLCEGCTSALDTPVDAAEGLLPPKCEQGTDGCICWGQVG
jgi:hypothetical protein